MANGVTNGSVAALWRFPVKSMRGERLDEAVLQPHGIVGDRAYALIEKGSGKVVTAKSVRLFPDLMQCRAEFLESPRAGDETPPVRITLPNGTSVASDSTDVDRVLSEYWGRDVTLARAAPEDFTIDQYHPDIEGVDPRGNRDTFVEQKLGSALFDALGLSDAVPAGSLFDAYPMSMITSSTLDRLHEIRPESRFDERRFRMNATIATRGSGFVENDWVAREVSVGESVRLRIAMHDPRCVMTTLAQEDLPQDTEVLRTIVNHNRIQFADMGRFPCAGVFAEVLAPGRMRIGDAVSVSTD
jgi:uncharacterized protein YcbX